MTLVSYRTRRFFRGLPSRFARRQYSVLCTSDQQREIRDLRGLTLILLNRQSMYISKNTEMHKTNNVTTEMQYYRDPAVSIHCGKYKFSGVGTVAAIVALTATLFRP